MTALIAPQRGATGSSQMRERIPSGYKKATINQFTPEQMELFQSLFGQVSPDSFLGRLSQGDPSMFEEMEAPAQRQFAQSQGNIASRFSGMGMGARHGSGFQNTMNQAASDFSQDLASKRMALQRQAIMDLMGISNQLLGQRPQEQALVEKRKKGGGWGGFVGSLLGGGGGFMAGGPAGALAGAKLGYDLGSGF